MISAFALMRLVVQPVLRPADRALERAVGAWPPASSSSPSPAAWPASRRPTSQLLVLRGIGGIGSAMFTVSAITLLLASRRGRAARPGRRLLPGRLPDRRHGRPGHRRAAVRHLADRALLLLRRHPGRGRHGRPGAAAHPGSAAGPGRTGSRCRSPTCSATRATRPRCLTNLAQGWTSFGVRSALVPVLVVEVLQRPAVLDRRGLRLCRGGPDHRPGTGRQVRGHRRPPAGHDRRRAGWRAVDHDGRAVRPEHLGADRRAVRVRGGRGVPRHRPGGRGGRRDRRGPLGDARSRCSRCAPTSGPSSARWWPGLLADAVSYPAAFAVGAALHGARRRLVGAECRGETTAPAERSRDEPAPAG